jgi:hypothetical protein
VVCLSVQARQGPVDRDGRRLPSMVVDLEQRAPPAPGLSMPVLDDFEMLALSSRPEACAPRGEPGGDAAEAQIIEKLHSSLERDDSFNRVRAWPGARHRDAQRGRLPKPQAASASVWPVFPSI